MKKNVFKVLMFAMAILSCKEFTTALRHCSNCGHIPVPYPLSTGPGCGSPWYKVRCTAGTLWMDAVNNSSYMITAIHPATQRIIIRPPLLIKNACISSDFNIQGIHLDEKGPFNITSSNTILLLNCTRALLNLQAPIDCSSNSICHNYIKDNAGGCKSTSLCCVFKTGGSQTAYILRIHGGGCAAYQSFVNFDSTGPVKKWPAPGLELEWVLPQEPLCKTPVDCNGLANSKCLTDKGRAGLKRCFCSVGFKWDPVNGMCQNNRCRHGRPCKIHKTRPALIGGVAFAAGAIPLGIVIGIVAYRKHSQSQQTETQSSLIKDREEILKTVRTFTAKEMTRATDNFSKHNLIGSGGFGEVFKGILDDGTITAIKRSKLEKTNSGSNQVLNEVRILCQVNHRNLVRLLGCCIELEHPIMVYEYIPNGTLFDHIHHHSSGKWDPLAWHRRLLIARQTAEGLAYLHSSAVPPIYHRDVKSTNILLDENLDAKVSDFGLSRLVEKSESNDTHIVTCAQGTLGYLDPEYYRTFQLTDKSDVYSFGVVLLELLTSKKAIDFSRADEDVNLVIYIKKIMDEERLMEVVDSVLKEKATDVELETMKALGHLAAACLDERRQNRPSMKEVVDEIEYIIGATTGPES